MTGSSSGGIVGISPWCSHAVTRIAARYRQAPTRKAPLPMAGSQSLRSRICAGVGRGPRASSTGRTVVSTMGTVSVRGV